MTAREAATARKIVPGVNAFGNGNWAQRLVRELNASGAGEFVTKYVPDAGAHNFSADSTLVAVVLA